MRTARARATFGALMLAAAAAIATPASAQQITTLVNFNATWRYNQPTTDPGTAWRANGFNDASWPQGPGLLQGGETIAYPVPYGTTITPPGATRITDYFRHTFLYNGPTNGITLYATNYVDDGAVLYLNGVEAARVRMTANPVTWTSLAGGGTEGVADVVQINPALLRPGQNNVLAVEVHQSGAGSSDVVWGTRLVAYQPTQLAITQQPQSQTVTAPGAATFTVTVTGSPVFYQWQKDQVNLLNQTNSTLVISPTSGASEGAYRVIVSNSVSRVVSSDAILTVVADTAGPIMQSAILQDSGLTNNIDVTFDETVRGVSVTTNSFRVIRMGTYGASAVAVTLSNVTTSGKIVRLRVGGPNWNFGTNYYIVANGITDNLGNLIAPNAVIGMSTQVRTNMAQMHDEWTYYDWLTDASSVPSTFPMIFTNYGANAWFTKTFVEDPLIWIPVSGIVYRTTSDPNVYICAGDGLGAEFGSHTEFPVYLRRQLMLPSGFGTSGRITFRHIIDDGLVLYLNGTEIYRWNMPLPVGAPLNYQTTRATMTRNNTAADLCITGQELLITNFQAGANILAAAVYQAGPPTGDMQADVIFGLEIDANFPRTPSLLLTNGPNASLRLSMTRQGTNAVISWPNTAAATYYGYILEETTALGIRASNTVWRAVSNGTNGAVIQPEVGVSQFFRLRRGPNSPAYP